MNFDTIIPFISLGVSLLGGLLTAMVKLAMNRLESDRLSRDKTLEELKTSVNSSTLEWVKLITKLQSSVDHMMEDRNRIQGEINRIGTDVAKISTLQEVMKERVDTIGATAEYVRTRNHELSNTVQQLMK